MLLTSHNKSVHLIISTAINSTVNWESRIENSVLRSCWHWLFFCVQNALKCIFDIIVRFAWESYSYVFEWKCSFSPSMMFFVYIQSRVNIFRQRKKNIHFLCTFFIIKILHSLMLWNRLNENWVHIESFYLLLRYYSIILFRIEWCEIAIIRSKTKVVRCRNYANICYSSPPLQFNCSFEVVKPKV